MDKVEYISKNYIHERKPVRYISHSVAGIAHDMRNVLAPVKMFVDLLKEGNLSDKSMETLLPTVSDALDQALTLNNKLLMPTPEAAQSLDVEQTIRQAVDLLTGGSGVHCSYHSYSDIYTLHVDKLLFERVIQNIVSNSLQAMNGQGSITISICNVINGAELSVCLARKPYVMISIKDDGPGMPEEILEKLLGTNNNGRPGKGLGLKIVRDILQQMGAYMEIGSAPGFGTRTTLYFPVKHINF